MWAVDQAVGPGTLYIYDGTDMNVRAASAVPDVFDLNTDVTPLCLAETGTAPVRGHMLGLNSTHSHAILAYVATGHVVFFNTETRQPVKCIDVGIQAHAAFASPDDQHVFVANQNGKMFHRISTDFTTETFELEVACLCGPARPVPCDRQRAFRHNAVGVTPGVGVIMVQQNGFRGKVMAVAPINVPVAPFVCTSVGGAPTLTERADIHTLKVVLK